jgi:DNA-binding IclR family transcriptional regulator
MSVITLTGYQVALMALLPKRAWGCTAEQLAKSSGLPLATVQYELAALVESRQLALDAAIGEYRNPGDMHE